MQVGLPIAGSQKKHRKRPDQHWSRTWFVKSSFPMSLSNVLSMLMKISKPSTSFCDVLSVCEMILVASRKQTKLSKSRVAPMFIAVSPKATCFSAEISHTNQRKHVNIITLDQDTPCDFQGMPSTS